MCATRALDSLFLGLTVALALKFFCAAAGVKTPTIEEDLSLASTLCYHLWSLIMGSRELSESLLHLIFMIIKGVLALDETFHIYRASRNDEAFHTNHSYDKDMPLYNQQFI